MREFAVQAGNSGRIVAMRRRYLRPGYPDRYSTQHKLSGVASSTTGLNA
jgi:hypothetical protein